MLIRNVIRLMSKGLRNLANNGVDYLNWEIAGAGTTKGADGIHIVNNSTNEKVTLNTSLLPNTVYTLVYTVKAASMSGVNLQTYASSATAFTGDITLPKTLGINKVLLTTVNSIVNNNISLKIGGGTGAEYIDISDIMIFEGDQRNNSAVNTYIPYGG